MRRRAATAAAAVTVGGAAYNVGVNRVIPDAAHVPAGLAAAAGTLAIARAGGLSIGDVGLSRHRLVPGLRAGLLAAAPVAAALGIGLAIPATRRLLVDERVAEATVGERLYHATIRIPIATAATEELLFRGVLLGLLQRLMPTPAAVAATSAAFGLWHVLPTLRSLESHAVAVERGAAGDGAARRQAVATTFTATAAAGTVFAMLRLRTRSLAAPAVLHTAVNVLAYAASHAAGRSAARSLPLTATPADGAPVPLAGTARS